MRDGWRNASVIAMASLILCSCNSFREHASMPPVPRVCTSHDYAGYIRASGRNLVDRKGRIFYIRGINLGNWLLPEGYMWKFDTARADRPRRIERAFSTLMGEEKAAGFWKEFRTNYIVEDDVRLMAETGFNTMRLALNYRIVMKEAPCQGVEPEYIPDGFGYIDRLIAWGKKYGLYVVIDLHAAPGGQTGSNIDDSQNDAPELYTNPACRAATIRLWTEIARRYRHERQVLAYDLLNEPVSHRFPLHRAYLEPFYKETVAAIRRVDPYHLITLEGANWAADWSVFGKPFDGNLLYQFHKYWNSTGFESIRTFVAFRDRYDVPIWCGEIGENSNEWYRQAFRLLEANAIGWGMWTWKNLDTTNSPCSIPLPANWEKICRYVRDGTGCTPEEGEAILAEYLANCRISRCVYNEDTMRSVFGARDPGTMPPPGVRQTATYRAAASPRPCR